MIKTRKAVNFPFVVEELESLLPDGQLWIKPMFGSQAVYFDEKIIFILRDKNKDDWDSIRDNGVWVATVLEHNQSLVAEFPSLRPIELFSKKSKRGFTGWLNLPATDDSFEESALTICRLVAKKDPRIGKFPKLRIRRP